jgi:PhnB protein
MAQVKPIPDGYHSVTPQLVFTDAARAIPFYEDAFGAKETARMPGPGGKIWHAELQVGDSKIFVGDEMPGSGIRAPSPDRPSAASIMLYVADADATFRAAVDAGARVAMELSDLFWGVRGGMVVDPFGYAWFVASRVRELSDEEVRRAGEEAVRQSEATGRTG